MTSTARDLFVTGLRNAHAMEHQAKELMERQIERMSDYPALQERLRLHLAETEEQLTRIDTSLQELGESASTLKDMALSLGANIAALGHAIAGDEVLKNVFANNAFENYEIAAYKSLIAIGDAAGTSASWMNQSLQEEERMASWVADNVSALTKRYLDLQAKPA